MRTENERSESIVLHTMEQNPNLSFFSINNAKKKKIWDRTFKVVEKSENDPEKTSTMLIDQCQFTELKVWT